MFECFRLIKNKDIERLMDLFSSDAIIHEPFSKLREGLKGEQTIESFLKIVIMANDALRSRIIIEDSFDIRNRLNVDDDENQNYKINSYNSFNRKVISDLVIFEKGDTLKARFTFELNSYDNNYDYNNHDINSKFSKITALHIQFIK